MASGLHRSAPSHGARLRRVLRIPRRRPFVFRSDARNRWTGVRRKEADGEDGVSDRGSRRSRRGLHRAKPVAALLPLPRVQRRSHADARDREVPVTVREHRRRATPHVRGHAVRHGRWHRSDDGCATRGRAGRELADLLLQRQRWPDDAHDHRQRLEQCAVARVEATDVGGRDPRAVRRSMEGSSCRRQDRIPPDHPAGRVADGTRGGRCEDTAGLEARRRRPPSVPDRQGGRDTTRRALLAARRHDGDS